MEETAEQLQAKANAAKAREDKENEERSKGLLEFIKGLLPEFSFFNLLLFGLVLTGAYFLGRTEDGKKLLGQMFDPETVDHFFAKGDEMLLGLASAVGINVDISKTLEAMPLDQVRRKLTEKQLPAEFIAILAKDESTWKAVVQTVRAANGGQFGLADLTNEKTLLGLAYQQPHLVRALLTSALKADTASTGEMGDKIKTTLLNLIASERFDVMLAPAHRAATFKMIQDIWPEKAPIPADMLTTLMAKNIGEDGKPTPALRNLPAAYVRGDFQALFVAFTDSAGNPSLAKAVDALLSADTRALIRRVGTGNIAALAGNTMPLLSEKNLEALLAFGDAIDAEVANKGANRPHAQAVVTALANIAGGTDLPQTLDGLTAEQISGFFAVPSNQEAMAALLKNIDTATLPAPARKQLTTLSKNWGNADAGVAEVLASRPDVAFILNGLRGRLTDIEDFANRSADLLGLPLATKLSVAAYFADAKKIRENSDVVAAVMQTALPSHPATVAVASR
ncbi:MAG: hypothetical protein SFW64_06500 [Alphaproteobacteria bacterium]|nr:hypothetical protein [Alphaproteobacteria bacterium]